MCLFHRFLTQYKGVYERDVKCQVKMSHNSGSVGQGPPSPSKDEVRTALLGCRKSLRLLQVCGIFSKLLLCYCYDALWLTKWFKCHLQGDGISPLVQTSVLGKGVKHRPPPIKLPSGSGSSSSGTCATSESSVVESRYRKKGNG